MLLTVLAGAAMVLCAALTLGWLPSFVQSLASPRPVVDWTNR